MVVSDGAVLPLSGTIDNTGTIALNSTGDQTELQIVGDGVTLEGGGKLTLSDSAANIIVGTGPNDTLTNVDNTISGAGQIGSGDGTLTLVNEAHGTIDANVAGGTLTLETGTPITNNGVLEAMNGGTLQIDDPVTGSGSAIIAGGTMIFDAQSNMNVTFKTAPARRHTASSCLAMRRVSRAKFPDLQEQHPTRLTRMRSISRESITTLPAFSETYNCFKRPTHGDRWKPCRELTFDNFDGTLSFASDGNGGTLITDPPAPNSSNTSVLDRRPWQRQLRIPARHRRRHHRQLQSADRYDRARSLRQHSKRPAIGGADHADAHGDAMIELGHGDSIDIPGVTPSYLQAHLQSLVHLH